MDLGNQTHSKGLLATAQTIATEFQSLNTLIHTSRFASPLSPYDERVMYELCHQLLVEESDYVGLHEEAMLPHERAVIYHTKVHSLMRFWGQWGEYHD